MIQRWRRGSPADTISLTVSAGSILGLTGPNGAGKTSLFNLISGVVQPDAGRIFLQDKPLTGPLHPRARAGVARTWQHVRLFRALTVLENTLVAPRDFPGESMLRSLVGINRATGTSIVLVEQNVAAALRVVELAVVLKTGTVIFDGASDELARHEDLWRWF